MNWVTTNIRLPEDLYVDLKILAAKRRKSVAAIIRERLFAKTMTSSKRWPQDYLANLKGLLGIKDVAAYLEKERNW
ncbi:MAG: hypothetical protein ACD_52C00057G0002 [uncultured bacterium]|nr:MAG: hypothetical protein ACD_52C00057G0002 [uncultured bacterium]